MSTVILSEQQINQKIRRIAFQILENNIEEKTIHIAGISTNGYILAKKLRDELRSISNKEFVLCEVKVDKQNPLDNVTTSLAIEKFANSSVVLVDDVLNSGRTLIYAVRYFLQVPLKKFKTAVLVDRNHKKFPVKSDFKGVSLSTSLEEHVRVEFEKETRAILF